MFKFLKKIVGTAHSRAVKKYFKILKKVKIFDEQYKNLKEEEILQKTLEFKERYKNNESLDSILPEAYGLVKNVCRRLLDEEIDVLGFTQKWDMVPHDVQILGAIAMHFGAISEMQTGEGKTITATLALYLNALSQKPVHLVTVNDYLAKRDCIWMGKIFEKLGISVASLTNDVSIYERKKIYQKDVVYGTASEFGFDYLRDNSMAIKKEDKVQRKPFFYAIIDEIDSILIDEARTPLIISGPANESFQMYESLKDEVFKIVKMQKDYCFNIALEARKILNKLNLLQKSKLTKEEEKEKEEAFQKLWLVSKGMPKSKILKKIKEEPDFRKEIEKWDTFYYLDQNKKEKEKQLSNLYIIVDERDSEYELTDKGINAWNNKDPFLMLDLGHEYAKIDQENILEQEKINKKNLLRKKDANRKEKAHNLKQLFRAHLLMEKDIDYIIQDNKIIIIDENTGRPQPGRRFSDGLHQAIEAKENVDIQRETQTYASITLQNYFRMYKKLSGMTGTAITEANEFKAIYNLEVLEIPTHLPCIRKDLNDKIYMTEREKYSAIIQEIKKIHKNKRPILIGTESVEISEKLSRILKQNKLSHMVLNAKNHLKEAMIIADAGKKGAITISTNMAGRGTDIKLSKEIKSLGGLHVIGTCRHHSRRIDRQLRGRSGRLGDPGSSQFFVSFEDSLMRLFASPRLTAMLQKFRPPEGEPISAKILNKSIETAQKRIEQRNYNMRKHTLEYDDVINKQRQEIYSFRDDSIFSEDINSFAKEIIFDICDIAAQISNKNSLNQFCQNLMFYFPITFEGSLFKNFQNPSKIIQKAYEIVSSAFDEKLKYHKTIIEKLNPDADVKKTLQEIIKNIIILKIDETWQNHLLFLDHLRSDVQLKAIAQKDPLLEFKQESFKQFDIFSKNLKIEIAKSLFSFEMNIPNEEKEVEYNKSTEEKNSIKQKIEKKIGRNAICPCGSGKKHKKCCGKSTF